MGMRGMPMVLTLRTIFMYLYLRQYSGGEAKASTPDIGFCLALGMIEIERLRQAALKPAFEERLG
jgi:hypothetical protein